MVAGIAGASLKTKDLFINKGLYKASEATLIKFCPVAGLSDVTDRPTSLV